MESLYHDSAYFVTLTYDDDHIPVVEFLDEETGEYNIMSSLRKSDFQSFIKQIRADFPNDRIRYYIAGEYGETTLRAHGHAILFGLHVHDLQPFGRSETGNQYYISDSVSDAWCVCHRNSDGTVTRERRGFVSIEPANEYTFKYVANYVTKKLGAGFNQAYKDQGLQPPFSLQSLKPGLGYQYLIDHRKEIMAADQIVIGTDTGSYKFKPPRYFYKKLEEEFDLEEFHTKKRYAAIDISELELENTDLNRQQYNNVKRESFIRGAKKRDGV